LGCAGKGPAMTEPLCRWPGFAQGGAFPVEPGLLARRALRALDRSASERHAAPVLLGLDLSATAAAVCAVPLDWDGDWRRVTTLVVGESLRRDATDMERARRTEAIAARLVTFARKRGASEAWIESYAFSRRDNAHTLAEVGGVVRLELLRAGIEIRTANMSTARKLLLGKVPRSEAKQACHRVLHEAGSPPWTFDESDAFVAANLGLSEHAGAFCFAQSEAA
jgi:hypothetical protein